MSLEMSAEGEVTDSMKEETLQRLQEELGFSGEDIDSLLAEFGDKCLVSVETFFHYKDKQDQRFQRREEDFGEETDGETPSLPCCEGEETDGETSSFSCCEGPRPTVNLTHGKTRSKSPIEIDDETAKKWTTREDGTEIREHIERYGLKDVSGVLKRNLDEWKRQPLNIAVTGMSGKGKSSLINSLRNLEPGDYGAAKIDEDECTKYCRPFPHPLHENFVFWDVPGAGTPSFPQETYLEKIVVDRYDFFLIVSSERFSEIDAWLVKEIRKRHKRFYFIRTKVDVDMENRRRRLRGDFDEDVEFADLKKKLRTALAKELGHDMFHFFMLSNNHPHKYDFPFLLHQLVLDVPQEKRLAMVFGITGVSSKIIEEKASALKSRIWKSALLSGVAAAIPIPFVSTSIDVGIILHELLFYRRQFALDDESLKKLADMAKLSVKELKQNVSYKTPDDIFTPEGLSKYLAGNKIFSVGEVAEKVAQYTIPGLGIVFSCGVSFATTMAVLSRILNMMKQDATNVLAYITKREAATCM